MSIYTHPSAHPRTYRYNYVYEIKFDDGLYYRGLHSTDNLEDGYSGSGTYVKRLIEDNRKYTKTIVARFGTRQEASDFEYDYIGDLWQTDPNCLNAMAGGDLSNYTVNMSKEQSIEHRKRIKARY